MLVFSVKKHRRTSEQCFFLDSHSLADATVTQIQLFACRLVAFFKSSLVLNRDSILITEKHIPIKITGSNIPLPLGSYIKVFLFFCCIIDMLTLG